MIEARATITLQGIKAGRVVMVDPSDDYIRMCLDAKRLVPTSGAWHPPEANDPERDASANDAERGEPLTASQPPAASE